MNFSPKIINRFCLFVIFTSYLRIFPSNGDFSIIDEGLKIVTYTRHAWPLCSEEFLARLTYGDTGHPFICCRAFGRYLFERLWSVEAGIRTHKFPHTTPTLCLLHRLGNWIIFKSSSRTQMVDIKQVGYRCFDNVQLNVYVYLTAVND